MSSFGTGARFKGDKAAKKFEVRGKKNDGNPAIEKGSRAHTAKAASAVRVTSSGGGSTKVATGGLGAAGLKSPPKSSAAAGQERADATAATLSALALESPLQQGGAPAQPQRTTDCASSSAVTSASKKAPGAPAVHVSTAPETSARTAASRPPAAPGPYGEGDLIKSATARTRSPLRRPLPSESPDLEASPTSETKLTIWDLQASLNEWEYQRDMAKLEAEEAKKLCEQRREELRQAEIRLAAARKQADSAEEAGKKEMCDSGTDASSLVAQLEQEVFALRIELLTIRGDLVFAEQSLSGDSGEGNGKAQGELEATMSAVADARGMLWTAGGGAAPGQKTSGFSSEEKHGQQAEQVAEVAAGTANDGGKDAAGASGESAEELKERLAEAEAKLARMTEVAKKFQDEKAALVARTVTQTTDAISEVYESQIEKLREKEEGRREQLVQEILSLNNRLHTALEETSRLAGELRGMETAQDQARQMATKPGKRPGRDPGAGGASGIFA